MKFCDQCRTTYPNDFEVCPRDRSTLRTLSEIGAGVVIRDKYEIIRKIGSGGMATVYEARHLAFHETRALKVVSSRLLEEEGFLRRFRTEAVVTRKLQHPNAVRVDDFDTTEDGRPYIVMEYVEGKDLRKVIEEKGALPIPRAIEIARQVASALSAAHALGITHRDIKPDNILIVAQPDGSDLVKVLDFGIAKIREGMNDGGTAYTATKTGVVVGTPQYMSPEQAMGKTGEAIDGRSDIYSLGCVMYEMVTGKLPFNSETPVGLLIAHIQQMPIPPHDARPDLNIPEGLSYALMKSLQKKREDRFQSAEEFVEALDDAKKSGTMMMGSAVEADDHDVTEAMGSSGGPIMFAGGSTKRKTPTPPRTPAPPPSYSAPPPAYPAPPAPSRPAPPPLPVAAAPRPRPRVAAPPPPRKSHGMMWALVVIVVIGVGVGAEEYFRRQAEPASQPRAAITAAEADDARIKDEIQRLLADTPDKASVEIRVTNGVVILGGTVKAASSGDALVAAVKNMQGVKDVVNQMRQAEASIPAPAAETLIKPTAAERPAPVAARPAPAKPAVRDTGKVRELVSLGNRQVDSGDYASAISSFQQALAIDPSSSEASDGLRRANQAKATEEEVLRRRR
jgi:serine/threonine protein kinase